jgi:two-component sensor histidine kinase
LEKYLVIFCLLLSSCIHCFGQLLPGTSISALNLQLLNARTDTGRLRLLHAEGDFFLSEYNINNGNKKYLDSAFQNFDHALKLSLKTNLDTRYGRFPTLLKLGEIWMLRGDTTRGKLYLQQVAAFYHSKNDLLKEANALLVFYKYMAPHNTLLGLREFAKLFAIYLKLKQNDEAIICGYDCVVLNYQLNKKAEAERICISLINQFKDKKCTELNRAYRMLATIYRYQGNLNKALQVTMEGIKWANNTQGKLAILKYSDFYGEMGLIYQDIGQTENSVYWYRKTIDVREKIMIDQRIIFRTAGFMIQGLIKLHKTKEALNYLDSLIRRKPPVNDEQRAEIAQIKAYCFENIKRIDLADKYYKLMLRLSATQGNEELGFLAKYDVAAFYVRQQKYNEAAQLLKGHENIDKPLPYTRDTYLLLFKIDSAKGSMIDAVKNYQYYKTLNDSIFNTERSKQVSELQIKYATSQKEQDIKLLKKDQLLKDEKIKQANNSRNLTFIGIILLSIVLGLLYKSYRIVQKKTKEIDVKNVSLHELVTEKDGLLREKEWLMKEIHHRVKNNLQIVMGLLQRQSSFINNKEALAAIRNSEHRMNSIALIHQRLYQSDTLMLVNMVDYINEMVGYLQECFALENRIRFEKQIADIDFEVSVAVPIALILNEAITNAIKYACHDHQQCAIRISLQQTGEYDYLLEIADNGPGLPENFDLDNTDSMGLNLMRGLSKQLGGKLQWLNQDGLVIRTTCHIG